MTKRELKALFNEEVRPRRQEETRELCARLTETMPRSFGLGFFPFLSAVARHVGPRMWACQAAALALALGAIRGSGAQGAGAVLFDGSDIFALGESYRGKLGYLPQDFGYYPGYTAEEYLLYIAALKGLRRPLAKKRAWELMEAMGLEKLGKNRIKSFSGGMKQRLGIAQALLNRPSLLVLDEPTAGLDPKERVRLRNLLTEYAGDSIVILSTHIVSDVEATADDVLLMKDGKLLLRGGPGELAARARGLVWELPVEERDIGRIEACFTVTNLRREEGKTWLRLISRERPGEAARPCEPGLEDLYLSYFPQDKE